MLRTFHIEMMRLALGDAFSSRALAKVIHANLSLDDLSGLVGHHEYHFDHNAFEESYAYIEEQRARTVSSLAAGDVPSAWSAFGRLTHTAQDFYAHSNYIDLWLAGQPVDAIADDVDPLCPDLLHSPALSSGKIYLLEVFTLVPLVGRLITPLLPPDSHGRMNLDSPESGPRFAYAFEAAIRRTKFELERTTRGLPPDLLRSFLDRDGAGD